MEEDCSVLMSLRGCGEIYEEHSEHEQNETSTV